MTKQEQELRAENQRMRAALLAIRAMAGITDTFCPLGLPLEISPLIDEGLGTRVGTGRKALKRSVSK